MQNYYYPSTALRVRNSLIVKVMWLLAFSVVAAIFGVYLGISFVPPSLWWVMLIAEVVLVIATMALREVEGLNFFLLHTFTFTTGLATSPVISRFIATGQEDAVVQSLAITGVLLYGLGGFAWTTKYDFRGLRGYLAAGLIGIFVVSVGNWFFHNSLVHSVINYFGVLLFGLYIIYDVQRAKYAPNTTGTAILLTLNIYLNILNLFLFILRLLGSDD